MLATRTATYRILEAFGEPCGVVVADPETNETAFRFRRDWETVCSDPEEAETLSALSEDLPVKAAEMGAGPFLEWFDRTFLNVFHARQAHTTIATRLERTAQALFHRHIRSAVKPFETHLPLYPIEAAAGGFGQDRESSQPEQWIDISPTGRKRLHADEFLLRIQGRSMEPEIPAGSICLFRRYKGGARSGGIWLVQRFSGSEATGEITIKRYERQQDRSIRMEPLNPEYDSWLLDAAGGDRFVSIAQFLEVIQEG